VIPLYLPIEVKHRELNAKVLLAMYAARRGFKAYLGRKSELNRLAIHMPPGVYYGLGVVKNFECLYEQLSRRGHIVVVNDEEGLVTHSDDAYLDFKVSVDTLRFVDRLFAWGEDNCRVIAAGRPEAIAKLRATGNPRFDLLKQPFNKVYEDERREIRRRYGNYVLICTSFASCNHYMRGLDYVTSLVEKKVLTTPESVALYRTFYDMKVVAWQAFLTAIPMLARAYPETNFIIRPHPSESDLCYQELAQRHSNVYVDAQFSIHPWLLDAQALVHHYCTSSVEAYAARVPGYALRPECNPVIEKEIPYQCSRECKSPNALVEAIAGSLASDRRPMPGSGLDYRRYVANIGTEVAAVAIVDEICAVAWTRLNGSGRSDATYDKRVLAIDVLRSMRQMVGRFVSPHRRSHRYLAHKFDGLKAHEVYRILEIFSAGSQDRFLCQDVGKNLVSVSL
jgi:surface carbohydrate biosynthesis protein